MRTGSESDSRLDHEQSFRPAFAEIFLYMLVTVILFFAAFFVFGLRMPQGASTDITAIYTAVIFGIWLVALTAVEYVAITRLSGGTKPRLRWSAGYPPVFAPWHAPGAVFAKRGFALVCALPALCAVGALLPVATLAFRAGVETLPLVVVPATVGQSLYFLRYTFWALSRPQATRIEVLEESGLVRTVQ